MLLFYASSSKENIKLYIMSKNVDCFHCQKLIIVKYVRACRGYSRKNSWEYWTESKESKERYICNDCLITLYYQHKWEFRQLIPNKEKQALLRQYIANDDIKGRIRKFFAVDLEKEEISVKQDY
jgi:hypothetical protein